MKSIEINSNNHVLVPKHEILDQEETEKVLAIYKIKAGQLPRIMEDDPAIKDSGVKVGDVVKITRNSPTAGKYVFYRIVVKG